MRREFTVSLVRLADLPVAWQAAFLLTALILAPGRVLAQQRPDQVRAPAGSADAPTSCCLVERVAGATLGAVVGGVLGYFVLREVGYRLTRGGGGEDPGLVGWVLGGLVGEAVGIGLGAHLGGGARGEPVNAIGASLGILMLGGMITQRLDLGENAIVIIPVAQVAAAVWAAVSAR